MIEINFLNSPDHEIIGKYKIYYDLISIGTSQKNDLIIEDPGLLDFHINIISTKQGIFCEGIKDSTTFQVNDKVIKGKKLFLKKDKIKIGNTIFEILDFSPEPDIVEGPSLKESYEKMLKDYPEQEMRCVMRPAGR